MLPYNFGNKEYYRADRHYDEADGRHVPQGHIARDIAGIAH